MHVRQCITTAGAHRAITNNYKKYKIAITTEVEYAEQKWLEHLNISIFWLNIKCLKEYYQWDSKTTINEAYGRNVG